LIPGGTLILSFPVPDYAVQHALFSRFRFSTEPGLAFVGIAIDGEVEDYLIDIIPASVDRKQSLNIPTSFQIYPNFPNPFNPATVIRFDLPANNKSTYHVDLSIYNMRGQFIRKLVDEEKSPGTCTVTWDGCDDFGQQVNSGIYLLKITADEYNTCIKMIILK